MEMEAFMDDLLNFSIPEEEEEEVEEEEENDDEGDDVKPPRNITRRKTESLGLFNSDDLGVVEEEDLEWISNKNAFPVIETFVGVLPPDHFHISSPERETTKPKQLSPVSVLDTSSNNSSTTTTTTTSSGGVSNGLMSCCVGLTVPVKPRSKRNRTGRRDLRVLWTGNDNNKERKRKSALVIGRKCQHCGADKTPQWRAGPLGPKTLCNACGVRFKSGRLVPEYRPANSPTFSAELHSNSHRKIVEMRKQVLSGDGDRRNDCG